VTQPAHAAVRAVDPLDDYAPAVPRERWIVVADVRTRALELEGSGPAVILIHGFGDSADTWRPLMRELAARGRRAVAVDLPHFGQADRPQSDDLLGLLDVFVAELAVAARFGPRPTLVGNSLGGLLVLRAGLRSDASIASIVGIGTPGIGRGRLLASLERWWLPLGALARLPLTDRLVRMLAIAFFLTARQGEYATRAQAALWAEHLTVSRLRHGLSVGQRLMGDLAADGGIDLTRVRPPVTLVYGSRDRLCPPRSAAVACRGVPGIRIIELPGAGHLTQLARPREIADLL
jgi:pimeloyl-ACP methyl ester carboxylesterase